MKIAGNGNNNARGVYYAFFLSCVVSIGGFLFGYDLVLISGAQLFLREQFQLSLTQFGFTTSSAVLGCIVGPSVGAWLADRSGRKSTLLISGVFFAVGAIGAGLAPNINVFNFFRIVGGVGVGLSSVVAPMYIAEIGPARTRGSLGIMYQLAVTFGCFSATVVSYLLATHLSPTLSWRFLMASVVVPDFFFIILLLHIPQSPRWLAGKGRFEEAFRILAQIDGEEFAGREIQEIQESLNQETGTLAELLEPGMRHALGIGIALAFFTNWTGWTSIGYYLPTLFQQAGYIKAGAALEQYMLIMAGNFLLTFVPIWLVDRIGRRSLWITASAAMFVCLTITGFVFYLNLTGPFVVATIFLCIAPHAIALGPLPWLMMSELYPTRLRARAVSISTTFTWLAGFTGPFALPIMEAASKRLIGTAAGLFWFYAMICVVAFFWGLKYLPETKGRTLEEIAQSWTVKT